MKQARWLLAVIAFFLPVSSLWADALDSLRQAFILHPQIQEKVYIQTDNNCYFVGDTLWYKAFVMRADNLRPTNMSKLLYVELLSPDGLVTQRQCIIVSDKGFSCGQFVLSDSLYSGYYELRAYTRWMLNFNCYERPSTREDRMKFYNQRMAHDFFRDWDGLYSRVIPIYDKPAQPGNYTERYMTGRPKQLLASPVEPKLQCAFFPEGGSLVRGLTQRVAFELTDQDGKAVDAVGQIGGRRVSTRYMGRGLFTVSVPTDSLRQRLSFTWRGHDYAFPLPKAMPSGVALTLYGDTMHVQARGCRPEAYALLCRGQLFDLIRLNGASTVQLDTNKMPTGVNEVVVLDENAHVLASRLFFINRHDKLSVLTTATDKLDYQPYERCTVTVKGDSTLSGLPFALSVRDHGATENTYDDGNIMTDCLLSSDLKGFIAHPAYYFESDDAAHRQALDLLMMVQGWRRYQRVDSLRYQPEKTLTIEGSVHKTAEASHYEPQWMSFLMLPTVGDQLHSNTSASSGAGNYSTSLRKGSFTRYFLKNSTINDTVESEAAQVPYEIAYFLDNGAFPYPGQEETKVDTSLKKALYVEAEVAIGKEVYGETQRTFVGRPFVFRVPPFYGQAYLRMTAYSVKDSVKHNLESIVDKRKRDEDQYADYYVKRDLFYPVFSHPYSYYQTHLPVLKTDFENSQQKGSKLEGEHMLADVDVEGKMRRHLRSIDYSKPAYVVDALQLYNEATDRGLSWGVVNMPLFPPIACTTVYGNMGRNTDFRVEATLDHYPFFRNYTGFEPFNKTKTDNWLWDQLHLKHIINFRFYTDFEPRNYDAPQAERVGVPDIVVDYDIYDDNSTRPTQRDRFVLLDGISEPYDFYSPDYSRRQPVGAADCRRTLYWNPNARLDAHGMFQATFFNNGKVTRMDAVAAGLTSKGLFMIGKTGGH